MDETDLDALKAILADPTHPDYPRLASELTARLIREDSKPTIFRQDLSYTHERLYRVTSGVTDSDVPYGERLASTRLMLTVLDERDFPPDLRAAFAEVMTASASPVSESDAKAALRTLIGLFLDLSERVVSGSTLGNNYDQDTRVVKMAEQGWPEPFLALFNHRMKCGLLPTPPMEAYINRLVRGQRVRRRRGSVHPARKFSIALLIESAWNSRKLEQPKLSVRAVCELLAPLVGGADSIRGYYYEFYGSRPRK